MSSMQRLSTVVEHIYASILEPDLLGRTYDDIADMLGGIGAVVIPVTPTPEFPPYVSGSLALSTQEYNERWWHRDPGVEAARRLERPLGVYATEDIVDAATMANHPFYTDFGPRYGFRYFLSMTFAPRPDVYLIFSVQRRLDAGLVSKRERRLAELLRIHLLRSTRIKHQLEHINRISRTVMDKLEQAPNGMAVLTPEGRVIFANAILDGMQERGLYVEGYRLRTRQSENQKKLDSLLQACLANTGTTPGPTTHIATLGTDGALPFIVRATRFAAHDSSEASIFRDIRDFVLLTVIDPNIQYAHHPIDELRALGLSVQEARLASLVASGASPQIAAEKMNLSVATSRSYLKSIFEKLGVASQSQVSALVAMLR